MAIYNGGDAEFQIGIEDTYGSAATPTIKLLVTKFNINVEPQMNESKALLGNSFGGALRRGVSKVSGDFSFECDPESLSTIIFLATGSEPENPAAVAGETGAYDHTFVPLTGDMLPSFTIVCDKLVDVFGFTGCKINQMTITPSVDNYLSIDLTIIGQQEVLTSELATLSASAKAPFQYIGFSVKTGTAGTAASTATDYVKIGKIVYNNNLDDSNYLAVGQAYTGEINYNKRSATISIESDLTDDVNTLRESNFKAGVPLSVRWICANEEKIASSNALYTLTFDILYGYIKGLPIDVPGADRLTANFDVEAKQGANGTVSFIVRDALATKVGA